MKGIVIWKKKNLPQCKATVQKSTKLVKQYQNNLIYNANILLK